METGSPSEIRSDDTGTGPPPAAPRESVFRRQRSMAGVPGSGHQRAFAGTGRPIASPYSDSPWAPPDVDAPRATTFPSAVTRTDACGEADRKRSGAATAAFAGTTIEMD